MDEFLITGGNTLRGKVDLCGAKNSGFKLIIASLYADQPSKIQNFSKIGDIYSTAEIIRELGGSVEFGENHSLWVSGSGLLKQEFSQTTGKLSRASTYFIGPLLYRFGKAILPVPGGCKIGRRPLDRHIEGIKVLGGEVKESGSHYEIYGKLKGGRYRFHKNTHGGTDIMIIAAASAKGKTILENAALEPEIDDLIAFLNKMGAKIKRTKNRTIEIEGVSNFVPADHFVMPDRNEAVTFACCALATKGDVFIKQANPEMLRAFLKSVKEIGGGYETTNDGIRFFYKGNLKALNIVTSPYPGFMSDWMAMWMILMTQTKGTSIVHETIFENRFAFVSGLQKMGAKIELFNPVVPNPDEIYNFNLKDDKPGNFHAARVIGPTKLTPITMEITDLRAGASLILASLIAGGTSRLTGVEHVDRGYENLDGRLKTLGADIKRIKNG
ncbi:UDP-N-acetylglucosamine 1-carboxyvinyltransferase [Candidatus Shapirobacteria bacterium CG03_land_8_20_14_0_80_40_19]|uniref:UDP-N-acetylglucosamine 1-carboxyvinyltransferase n=3 Tax=Candidatus Shapironibacteriota TaxID=1752721 RepID=A0A2M7BB00_9BACT|nr:MAG: UDP-N-acetylglucosamine 1-carboxyvinyltransferase [Candidatus Shapirobacteria bacterium CG11_big_fil_rev_8_21_14_0_20_40_12]PIV00298.1 MAG: UDP-N-acetylglucosamine 1-carboxyvinyltransferase [Candidatus Shapirobacteria bacterium CG03_land_8_20_14_0_80_40_19]PJC28705.1 MAG: UDP-N-acetylglucosamine 1-carboxyvinyltransferase [Candidatus Shapirobacteria bacterium CG_4_9_14_0_2_um_filter_40_11]